MPKRLPRSRTLKGDPKLAYYDSAGGAPGEPPIVLLHGATFRSEDWENIFPRLATRYRVIAYDARGHGKSGRAASYAIDALADDLLRVIETVAGGPAIVIGHSLGGATALVAAAKRPDAIRALVVEEPVVDNWDRDWRAQYYKDVRVALDQSGEPSTFKRAVASIPLPARGPRGERTVGEVRGFYAADRLATYYKDVDPAFVEQFGHSKPDGHEQVVNAVPTMPTLLLAAHVADGSALKEGEAEALVKKWPDAQLAKFPGVGHRIHGLRPEPFLEALEPFLRKARARGPSPRDR
jgi:pimeloyl-ACP methyl ester carboxylesterase